MIIIFRYGHRIHRDSRLTTHCGLIAHAFNADKFILHGDKDSTLIKSLENTFINWGSNFSIEYKKNFSEYINQKKKE